MVRPCIYNWKTVVTVQSLEVKGKNKSQRKCYSCNSSKDEAQFMLQTETDIPFVA